MPRLHRSAYAKRSASFTVVRKPLNCAFCTEVRFSHADIQEHMDTAHPGWASRAIASLIAYGKEVSGTTS